MGTQDCRFTVRRKSVKHSEFAPCGMFIAEMLYSSRFLESVHHTPQANPPKIALSEDVIAKVTHEESLSSVQYSTAARVKAFKSRVRVNRVRLRDPLCRLLLWSQVTNSGFRGSD